MKIYLSIIVLVLLFCFTEITLSYYLPLAKTDREVWLKYFITKDAIYDFMFMLFFLVVFWLANTANAKALATFGLIVTAGSFIDKVIFGINQYLVSDILLIIVALVCAIAVRLKWRTSKHGQ